MEVAELAISTIIPYLEHENKDIQSMAMTALSAWATHTSLKME
jgi:hypothetical protein